MKLVPQPQDALASGLLILNAAPIRSSTKSISEPARYCNDTESISTVAPSRAAAIEAHSVNGLAPDKPVALELSYRTSVGVSRDTVLRKGLREGLQLSLFELAVEHGDRRCVSLDLWLAVGERQHVLGRETRTAPRVALGEARVLDEPGGTEFDL